MFKVHKSLYLNPQIDLFMNTFALIFDFKQVQSNVFTVFCNFFFFSCRSHWKLIVALLCR